MLFVKIIIIIIILSNFPHSILFIANSNFFILMLEKVVEATIATEHKHKRYLFQNKCILSLRMQQIIM